MANHVDYNELTAKRFKQAKFYRRAFIVAVAILGLELIFSTNYFMQAEADKELLLTKLEKYEANKSVTLDFELIDLNKTQAVHGIETGKNTLVKTK